jgi:hypothetical protein
MRKLLQFALGIYSFGAAICLCFGNALGLILMLGANPSLDPRYEDPYNGWRWGIFVCGLGLFCGHYIAGAVMMRRWRHIEIKPPKPLEELLAGEPRVARATVKPELSVEVSAQVMTEALRLARGCVNDAIKRQGGKVSDYKRCEIVTEARKLLDSPESGPTIIEKAKANVDAMRLQARRTRGARQSRV